MDKIEFNKENVFETYRINDIDNLYNELYNTIDEESLDEDINEEEKICGAIYTTMRITSTPVIYGEFERYKPVDQQNVKKVVENIEQNGEYEKGKLTEEGVWDYVFMDMQTSNVTPYAEEFASQLVEYYEQSEEFREVVEQFDNKLSAAAIIYFYRNAAPHQTSAADHIPLEKTTEIFTHYDYDMYDVIDAYHTIFESSEYGPALSWDHIDPSGVSTEIINQMDKFDLTEDEKEKVYYMLYQIDSDAITTDKYYTALALLSIFSQLTVEEIATKLDKNKGKINSIKNNIELDEILVS